MSPPNMGDLAGEAETGILNETTGTIHKRDRGASAFHSVCGITYDVDPDHLQETSIDRATASLNVNKCGRCFPGAGGY